MLAVSDVAAAAMIGGAATVAVAVVGGPVMWVLTRLDRRNTEQHGVNASTLTDIRDELRATRSEVTATRCAIDAVSRDMADHLAWHIANVSTPVPVVVTERRHAPAPEVPA